MRLILIAFIVPLFINSCQSGTTKPEASAPEANGNASQPAVAAGEFQMKPDTIEISGKFLQGCTMPHIIKIAEHNELNSPWKEVPVSPGGEFKYRIYLAEPRRIALRTENRTMYDFIATTQEKNFQIEITCANGMEKFDLKNSAENKAYRPFNSANKKFREDLDSLVKQDISKKEVFTLLQKTITEYLKTLDGIASANPGTFTATVLCAAEKLPDGSLNSAEALRKNFLQREALANPQVYNDFLGQRIILNYTSICDRKTDQYETLDRMMNIAMKNPDAAKRLQQISYNIFYNRHEEELLTSYIAWAEKNPNAMYNQSVKMQLARLKKVMPGNQMIEVELNDPSGAPKKLSDVVHSAKLTLLIFYSPTCSHCQEEIPQIKPLWDQYKNKGLKIYATGFEATKDEWNWFINNKAYPDWIHVFEYPDGPRPSEQYVVNYTPTFILIDQQGKIVTRMPEISDLKTDIPKLLD